MPYKNKEKQLEAQRKHYKENQNRYMNNQYRRRMEKANWFFEYKSTLKCSKCGENHPACIQFHHTDPSLKENDISSMVNAGYNKDRIIEEINKCEIVCANCHFKLHWQERVDDGVARVSTKHKQVRDVTEA